MTTALTRRFAALLVGLAAVASAPAFAQGVTTAGLVGTVTDAAGDPVPGANVVAVHTPSGTEYGAATNFDGNYRIPNMRVGGPYTVRATFVGLQPRVREGIRLTLGEFFEADFRLDDGATLDGVTVTAGGVFDPSRSGVDLSISDAEIQALPSIGRDLADYARLTPQAYVENDDDDGPAISIAGQNNRYNSIYIDGAVSNDVFGLSAQGTNGGQTGSTPISIDAIEQFQIALSPFDVTQSGFTGGAINAVTRSGTNTLEGSLYYLLRNEDFAGRTPGGVVDFIQRTDDPDFEASKLSEFSSNRYGFRVGGPIVQDKLFFFANGEILRQETPLPALTYGGDAGVDGLNTIRETLRDEVGYDAGDFGDKAGTLDDNKLLFKLDFNASPTQRLSARYSYSGADNVDNFATSTRSANFANNAEFFPNRTHSLAVELNSTLGNNAANKLIVGYSNVDDDRGVTGDPFPSVVVNDGGGRVFLGSEPFSTVNRLTQDIFTVTNNFNYFLGDHTLTLGVAGEYYSIANAFVPRNFGSYDYDSVDDFLQSVCAAGNGSSAYCQANFPGGADPVAPSRYQRGYSLVDNVTGDGTDAIGAFDAFQVGVYAQDEYRVSDALRVTAGLRLDVPSVVSEPRFAPDVFDTTIPAVEAAYDLNGAAPGQTPGAQLYLSPRLGFNYDASEAAGRQLQLRGGTGIFTGRVPFVWPGGMFLNNGTNTGFVFNGSGTLPDGSPVPFIPDPDQQFSGDDFGQTDVPSGRLEIFEDDFRYPTVWRTSLGLDAELPGGFVGTIEGQYTKTLHNIEVTNVNLNPDALVALPGADNRMVYQGSFSDRVIDPRYSAIHRVGTTSEGYTYDVTARLLKELRGVFAPGDQLFLTGAITFGDAYSVNDGLSSQINSLWRGTPTVSGLNDLELARSSFSIGTRAIAGATFRKEFLSNLATTVSLFYTGESGRPFSYTIDNSDAMINAPGARDAGLLYVPTSGSEIRWTGDAAASAAAFDAFVASSDYLSSRRGDYAERNGSRTPFEHIFDFKLSQEIFANLAGSDRGLELTVDVFNVGNLLSSAWGTRYAGLGLVELIEFRGFDADGVPTYRLEFDAEETPTEEEYFNSEIINVGGNYGSRWLAQVGLRLNF